MKPDEKYELAINKLIPLAVKEAKNKVWLTGVKNAAMPGKLSVVYNHDYFSEYFHLAMKRLAIENELRKF